MYRSRKQSDSRLREGGEGTSRWLAYDRRTFGEILSDWQQAIAPGDVPGFIRDHLHLEQALTTEQFLSLVSDQAVPSRELALYLSAVVPTSIATPIVMRNRATTVVDGGRDSPVIAPRAVAILNARGVQLRTILHSAPPTANPSYADWRVRLFEHVAELAPDAAVQPTATLANLAQYLAIDPAVLSGDKPMLPEKAEAVASELAQLLKLEGDDFDDFTALTCEALSGPAATLDGHGSTAPFGRAIRFIRYANGLSQSEFAKRLGTNLVNIVALERGGLLSKELDALGNCHLATTDEIQLLRAVAPDLSLPFNTTTVVNHFVNDGLTAHEYLNATLRSPHLLAQRPSTLIANVEGLVSYFTKDGLTTREYLKAATRHPSLFSQRPSTLVANIEGVVNRFANDGLTRHAYIKNALRWPPLFSQRSETLIANIEGVVSHFAKDGLTTREYLKAANRQPQLFSHRSSKLVANIDGVVNHFAKVGLSRHDYIKTALRWPPLFYQRSQTLIANIEGVVSHFAEDGLTTREYLKAATRHPSLFSQRPSTLVANIEGVVSHFAKDGLTTHDYLKAVLQYPQLFAQRPSTLIHRIDLLRAMHQDGLLRIGPDQGAFFCFVCSHPRLLINSDDSLFLRRLASHITGRHLGFATRTATERKLIEALSADQPDSPVDPTTPESRSHARRLLLNALKHEGYLRSK